MNHKDNLILFDESLAVQELKLYGKSGGKSLIDCTSIGLGRNPLALRRISEATGLNIIMGAGYYAAPFHPPDMDSKSEEEITDEMVREIMIGLADTGIKAGIIGELGCSWPLNENEKKVLRASARAQEVTGAAITVHPGRHMSAYFEVVEFLDRAGADLSRTIIEHVDRGVFDHAKRLQMIEDFARRGCYIEYDAFGHESYWPYNLVPHSGIDRINDPQRIDDLYRLIDKGYGYNILMAQDCCMKINLCEYGGAGYAHILNDILPRMRNRGITDEAIETILVDNPKRVLTLR
jgi:phosphotriesterase-related protein